MVFRTEAEERRAALIMKYEFLRNTLPDLPVELFDYQVRVVKTVSIKSVVSSLVQFSLTVTSIFKSCPALSSLLLS